MKPRRLQHACGWAIACSFTRKVWHLNITQTEGRARLVEFLIAYAEHYRDVMTLLGLEQHLYKRLISWLRNRHNPAVFLTSMLLFCSKVTIDQIAMVAERRQDFGMGSGLYLSVEECWSMLQVISEFQKKQAPHMNLGKESDTVSFTLPTTCLVLEGVYFAEPDFLMSILRKMPNLRHISLQHNRTKQVMKTLSRHCKLLESLCFLEPTIDAPNIEEDILTTFFGMPSCTKLHSSESLAMKFAYDEKFRESLEFQFPNLRKLDIDELVLDEDVIRDIYILTLLLQPKLVCFGKHTGITKRFIANYKRTWCIMHKRPASEVTLLLAQARFVDTIYELPSDSTSEVNYWEEMAPMFENLTSIELQKQLWSEDEVAEFIQLFNSHVRTFSLSELPLSNMSCLSNTTHLRLTLRRHYSFDTMHVILDSCPNLKTLSIHPHFYHEAARRNGRVLEQPRILIDDDDLDVYERLLFAEMMGEAVNLEAMVMNLEAGEFNPEAGRFPWGAAYNPPPEPPPDVRPALSGSSRTSKKKPAKHHNLTSLRIASLCEAGMKQSEDFLRGLLERLPNLHHLCLGMWMGPLNQYLTCTANALVTVVTDENLKESLLPQLTQLCCLPSGTETEMCKSLAALVEALPTLHTLVLPALDNMLTPTLRYFQHSSLDIQYKCAIDQVFSYWEPEH